MGIALAAWVFTGCGAVQSGETQAVISELPVTAEETEMGESDTLQVVEIEIPSTAHEVQQTYRVISSGRTSADEVKQINIRTMSTPESGVVDLFGLHLTGTDVENMIESYAFPTYTWLNGQEITDDDYARILENRNLSALSGQESSFTYGILTENAAVRSFPTEERLTQTENESEKSFDYFQESMLLLGEPVLLLHTSLDGQYVFVQGQNYYGWIKAEAIQTCDVLLAQAVSMTEDFVVITDGFFEAGEEELRMGTALTLLDETDTEYIAAVFCTEQEADGCIALQEGELRYYRKEQVPDDAEVLWVQEQHIPKSSANAGYMELTQDNILLLAANMMGNSYSWGDEHNGYDCSSTVGSIYRCFGIYLPRNSGILKYTGAQVADLEYMTTDEKRAYIMSLPAGTILVMPGHVMMYLGDQFADSAGQIQAPAMLHCVTEYVDVDGVNRQPYACVVTSIDIRTRGTESYLDLVNTCISFGAA